MRIVKAARKRFQERLEVRDVIYDTFVFLAK